MLSDSQRGLQGCHLPGRVQNELGDKYTVAYQYERITPSRHICDVLLTSAHRTRRQNVTRRVPPGALYRHVGMGLTLNSE